MIQAVFAFLLAGAVVLCSSSAMAIEPSLRVLATIKPLQLIATAVTAGSVPVDVLLDARISPHDYQLRPSDRAKLDRADVVFWIGPELEVFLASVLSGLPARTQVTAMSFAAGDSKDPHLWMDPLVAAAIGMKMADVLGELAPAESARWHANAERLAQALREEERRLRETFAAIESPNGYLVAHDAYGRFESRYGLHHLAALTNSADLPPTVQNMANIQQLLKNGAVQCVLREPQTDSRLLRGLLVGRHLRVVAVDALAVDVPVTKDGILLFYRALGEAIIGCLRP